MMDRRNRRALKRMDKRLGKKTGLSKAGLISSITMGAVLGTIVWYFLLKCEEPSCPINYVHLIFCLLIFSFFGWQLEKYSSHLPVPGKRESESNVGMKMYYRKKTSLFA